jgi:hypothetical protein
MMELSYHRHSRGTTVGLIVAIAVLSWNMGLYATLVSNPPRTLEIPSLLFAHAKPGEDDRNRGQEAEVADERYLLADDSTLSR